jgi:hydroxymethylglutaryl-CoA synthase
MHDSKIGLGDLAIYVPAPSIELSALVQRRITEDPSLERRLRRAIDVTGQRRIRFPELWQDNATLAAQATHLLFNRDGHNKPEHVRYLTVGTETTVDHSKPIAAYVEGMMEQSGVAISQQLSTFQVQHACAGGTIAMMSVGALLQAGSLNGETGVVICSDIARYEAPSTAEITQGAGAVAMFVEKNPRLLELDLTTQGYHSRDVDDFFRPLGSTTAKVKGSYSVQLYNEALEAAFADHCRRRGEEPARVLEETDMFVLHVPFFKMALTAVHKLVGKFLDIQGEEAEAFLAERGFPAGIEAAAEIGNIYSGSAYLALAFSLEERFSTLGDDLVGKNVMLASYGSGNTMVVLRGTVAPGAPDVIRGWNLPAVLDDVPDTSMEKYNEWISAPLDRAEYAEKVKAARIPEGAFFLGSIRDDGYREYSFK